MRTLDWRRSALLCLALLALAATSFAQSTNKQIGINVAVKGLVTNSILADLGQHGRVRDVIYQLNAVTMQAPASALAAIQAKPYVEAANPDALRKGSPVDTVAIDNFSGGMNSWNLDAVNVTNFGSTTRAISFDGSGVYIAVLDTGLLDSWRQYFPQERIATQYAIAFGGGGGDNGTVSTQPNKWEHDQNSHGTHVVSSILGYRYSTGQSVNGVAPMANVIPVKVLNQTGGGWGWSSVIARGIVYVADLKATQLAASPVVISMSLSGSALDAIEKRAVDYAISNGVTIVAAASNDGNLGMGYPAAYEPVLSVAAAGTTKQWTTGLSSWWRTVDVPDPSDVQDLYIAPFSSRAKAGQYLDVTAPGSLVPGPYQVNSGQTSYFYLNGTSMATPHVSGIVALLLQQNPNMAPSTVEATLESAALPMDSGCRQVRTGPSTTLTTYCWGPGYDPASSIEADGAGFITADRALGLN